MERQFTRRRQTPLLVASVAEHEQRAAQGISLFILYLIFRESEWRRSCFVSASQSRLY